MKPLLLLVVDHKSTYRFNMTSSSLITEIKQEEAWVSTWMGDYLSSGPGMGRYVVTQIIALNSGSCY